MATRVDNIPQTRQVFYCTYASLPITGLSVGDLGYATDREILYEWDGSAWQPITFYCGSGLAANIPSASNLPDGSLYFETDTQFLKQVQSGAWASIISAPLVKVYKTANQTVNNSTTLVNDTHLKKALAANEIFEFEAKILYQSGTIPDFKFDFTVPSGATIANQAAFAAFDVGVTAFSWGLYYGASAIGGNVAAAISIIKGIVINGANAGDLQFRWAQNTADASDTKVLKGSCIIGCKLA